MRSTVNDRRTHAVEHRRTDAVDDGATDPVVSPRSPLLGLRGDVADGR
jgi:hypothetical protein